MPRDFYGTWPELERIEVGERAADTYDETSSLMHRMIKAVDGKYTIKHNNWDKDVWMLECCLTFTSVKAAVE